MELILNVNMDDKAFATFKYDLFKAAKAKYACDEGMEYHLLSTTPQEWLDNCGGYLGWLGTKGIDLVLKGFTYSDGGLDLCGYELPLPKGFTYCNGYLDVEGHKHPLPNTFTHCNGYLDICGHAYALPEGFTHCNGSLSLNGYDHPLPLSFTHCGGSLSNEYYKHPLPIGFRANVKY